MRLLDERLCGFTIDAGQADIQAGAEKIFAVRQMQIDLGVDGQVGRRSNISLAGRRPERALEAGRPTGREQLLGIRAEARGARRRELDVEAPIRAARGALSRPPVVWVLAVYTTFPPLEAVRSLASWVIALSCAVPPRFSVQSNDRSNRKTGNPARQKKEAIKRRDHGEETFAGDWPQL